MSSDTCPSHRTPQRRWQQPGASLPSPSRVIPDTGLEVREDGKSFCGSPLKLKPPSTLPRQERITTQSKGAELPYFTFKNALLSSQEQQPHPSFIILFRAHTCTHARAHTHTHIHTTKTSYRIIIPLMCLLECLSFLSSFVPTLLFWEITNIPQHRKSSIVNSHVPNTQLQ